jgi:hypothetical protein
MAEIQKVSFTHEALILWLLEFPHKSLRDCAMYFGYTQSWLSQIIHSDAFQQQLAKRQNELMAMTGCDIRDKLAGAADIAIEGLTRKLEESDSGDFFLDASDKLLNRLGYGPASARNVGTMNVQNNVQQIVCQKEDLENARAMLLSGQQIRPALVEKIIDE